MTNLSQLIDRIIFFSYLSLVIITPILFSTQNTELFEVPKMIFVYFFAALILVLTKLKFLKEKRQSIPFDLVTVSFAIFLLIQVASTVTSIDKFTSIFGYPSRLNGGLLSQFAYFIIFVAALINLNRQNVKILTWSLVLSASVVALWGIPAHFGVDPNCFILSGNLNSTCWQTEFDPTKRIFSTLGQPNWLASYLVLILPLAVSQIATTKVKQLEVLFAAATLSIFIAFIFTNSRAGIVGLAISATTFAILIGTKIIQKNLKIFLALAAVAVVSVAIFGGTLFARINEIVSPHDSPGTESSKIRLIVWQGALEIVKKNPLLGTGPETFAYSYYKVRPLAHNETTEWNFFYNKAHNEFLNLAANIGFFGLSSYFVFLSAALYSIWKITRNNKNQSVSWQTKIHAAGVFSAICGYLVTIFFGFSVVTTQLLMFLLIAFAQILGDQTKFRTINIPFLKNTPAKLISAGIIGFLGLYFLVFVARLLASDILINRAKGAALSPDTLLMYSNVQILSPIKNPFYMADTAVALATYGENSMIEHAKKLAEEARQLAPQNIIVARRIANAYILISGVDRGFYGETRKVGEIITSLAPTDPQSYLTLAKIQITTEENERAKYSLQKALNLKPDYVEAIELLEQLTSDI